MRALTLIVHLAAPQGGEVLLDVVHRIWRRLEIRLGRPHHPPPLGIPDDVVHLSHIVPIGVQVLQLERAKFEVSITLLLHQLAFCCLVLVLVLV